MAEIETRDELDAAYAAMRACLESGGRRPTAHEVFLAAWCDGRDWQRGREAARLLAALARPAEDGARH